MKHLLLLLIAVQLFLFTDAQVLKGTVITETINAVSLKNPGGENPARRITIYLPPGYNKTTSHYPVIYYLHGFAWDDSLLIANDHLDQLLDKAIASGKIRPVIVVMPNEYTLYRGSFYTNSSLTGNWSDFTAHELVEYIDKHYRTIPDNNSRGIAGHSMGGHGALKIAMLFPEVFSAVYALSPAVLGLEKEVGSGGTAFKRAGQIKSREALVTGWDELPANLLVAMARAYSPDKNNAPFFADLPYTYTGDSLITHKDILDLWKKNTPLYMIDTYISNIRKLKAIKLDWGRNDEFSHIPYTCKMFSQRLESLSVKHYAEEYIGTHGSMVSSEDGRILNELLPFFDTYLKF